MRREDWLRTVRAALCAASAVLAVLAVLLLADPVAAKSRPEVVELGRTGRPGALPVVGWDAEALTRAERLEVRGLPLGGERSVDLELEAFAVTRPDTQFVRGRPDGADEPLDFDPASVSLFRGSVIGEPRSRAFLTRHRAASQIRYLNGPEGELRRVWKEYQVLSALESGDADTHSAPVRIYGRGGRWLATQHAGADLSAGNLVHDISLALAR